MFQGSCVIQLQLAPLHSISIHPQVGREKKKKKQILLREFIDKDESHASYYFVSNNWQLSRGWGPLLRITTLNFNLFASLPHQCNF